MKSSGRYFGLGALIADIAFGLGLLMHFSTILAFNADDFGRLFTDTEKLSIPVFARTNCESRSNSLSENRKLILLRLFEMRQRKFDVVGRCAISFNDDGNRDRRRANWLRIWLRSDCVSVWLAVSCVAILAGLCLFLPAKTCQKNNYIN